MHLFVLLKLVLRCKCGVTMAVKAFGRHSGVCRVARGLSTAGDDDDGDDDGAAAADADDGDDEDDDDDNDEADEPVSQQVSFQSSTREMIPNSISF